MQAGCRQDAGRGEQPSDDFSDDGSAGYQAGRQAFSGPGSPGQNFSGYQRHPVGRPIQGLRAMEETCEALQAEVNSLQGERETLMEDYGHLLLYNMELRRQIANAGGAVQSPEQRLMNEGGMPRVVLLHQTAIGPGALAQNKDYGAVQQAGPVARVIAAMGSGSDPGTSSGPPAKLHRTMNDTGSGAGGGTWVLQPATVEQQDDKAQLSTQAGFPYATGFVSAGLQQPATFGQLGVSALNVGNQHGSMLQVGSMSLAPDATGQHRMLLLPNTAQAGLSHLTLQGPAQALQAGTLGPNVTMLQHGPLFDTTAGQVRPAQLLGTISAQPQGSLLLNQTPDQLLLQRQQLQQQLGLQQQQLQALRSLQPAQGTGGDGGNMES